MMAAQTTVSGLFHQIRNDANAPLYYVVISSWAKVAGLSNLALRIPNIAFGLGAATLGLCSAGSIDRRQAMLWGVLLALWQPSIALNFDARCYSLLLLLATLTVVAYVRLLQKATRARATIWAAAACLTVLTHYHASFLVAAQALVLLVAQRGRALKLWPAALMFLPGCGWVLYHFPRLEQFARPDVAWYTPLQAMDLVGAALFCCGGAVAALGAVGVGALILARTPRLIVWARPMLSTPSPVVCAVLASAIGLALCLAAAALRPSFTIRYLTPFAPGMLLGLALLADAAGKRINVAYGVIPLAFAVTAIRAAETPSNTPYTFEAASSYIQQGRPKRLEFLWDHPATQVEAPDQLAQVGGFFLARAGYPVKVDPVILAPGADPNQVLISRATPGSAILWLYDLSLRGVAANRHSPHILQDDRRWRCRNFGQGAIGVLACLPAHA